MRYIRFLKPPKILGKTIAALITITSDLGESFFDRDVLISASIISAAPDGEVYLRKAFTWKAGMRSLPISFKIEDSDIDWPARMLVNMRNVRIPDHFEKHYSGIDLPNIISASSDLLDLPNGKMEASKTLERKFTPLSERQLSIWEETGESIARHIWDAGITLAAYIDRMVALQVEALPLVEEAISSAAYKTLKVIELGAGCGIVGIALAQSVPDCQVILTDLPEAREIAQRNIDGMNPAMMSTVSFTELNWEQPLPDTVKSRSHDLILVADCTYNPDSGPALVHTLSALVEKSPRAVVLLSMKVRHRSELLFFDLMKQADFVQSSRVRLALPEQSDEPEAVQVYVFHHRDRPNYVNKHEREPRTVHFWPE